MKTRRPRAARLLILMALTSLFAQAVAAESKWTKKSFAVEGSWSLVENGGKTWLVLDSGFATKKAPDLKLFLSPNRGATLTGKNATEGAILVGKLKSHKGSQRFEIPVGVDLSQYVTLALHCQKYAKLWAVSSLP